MLTSVERKYIANDTLLSESAIRNWEAGKENLLATTIARIEASLEKLAKKSNAARVA